MTSKKRLKRLTQADKLFRVSIALRILADETTDARTRAKLFSIVDQLGM